jgi:hypothetical protein
MQTAIVIALLGAALLYSVINVKKALSGKGNCGCGDKCTAKKSINTQSCCKEDK